MMRTATCVSLAYDFKGSKSGVIPKVNSNLIARSLDRILYDTVSTLQSLRIACADYPAAMSKASDRSTQHAATTGPPACPHERKGNEDAAQQFLDHHVRAMLAAVHMHIVLRVLFLEFGNLKTRHVKQRGLCLSLCVRLVDLSAKPSKGAMWGVSCVSPPCTRCRSQ